MEKQFWKSKKFWMTLLGIILSLLRANGILEVPIEAIGLTGAYVVGQGIADLGKGKPKE